MLCVQGYSAVGRVGLTRNRRIRLRVRILRRLTSLDRKRSPTSTTPSQSTVTRKHLPTPPRLMSATVFLVLGVLSSFLPTFTPTCLSLLRKHSIFCLAPLSTSLSILFNPFHSFETLNYFSKAVASEIFWLLEIKVV